jgi:uncharacterized protein (DUF1330 family)
MSKGYWISSYKSISNLDKLTEYAKLAGPAIQAGGGRFLARGNPVKTYEQGINLRIVVIEFESVEKAMATFESPAYQAAVKVLDDGGIRDVRIVEATS